MAYFIVSITDEIRDFENITSVLTECQEHDIADQCNDIARNWYGSEADLENEADEDCGVYLNGDVRTYVGDWKQITEACYQELKGFLTTL